MTDRLPPEADARQPASSVFVPIGMTIDECREHIGDTVIWYPPTPFDGGVTPGTIVSVDGALVNVHYEYDGYNTDGATATTHPGNLKLVSEHHDPERALRQARKGLKRDNKELRDTP